MKRGKCIFVAGVLMLMAMAVCSAVAAVTVDSSYGWNSSYTASNTVDGLYGASYAGNMGWANMTNAWVIYDFGVATTVKKVRVTPPYYGGSTPQTFNPTSGTFEFSNDKVTWSSPIAYSAPQLNSVARTDYAECAMPQAMNYRYLRWTIPNGGRVGEIWFLSTTQLACWEMNQDATYSKDYPAWQTVDGNPGTFANISGDPGGYGQPYITYDMGISEMVYGFTMQARSTSGWSPDSITPHGGELWVSDDPVTGYTKVGDFSVAVGGWGNGEIKTFNLGNAQLGRYVQLRNMTGGSQWAEFTVMSNPVPEPGAILALASGLMGFAGLAMRKRTC